MMKKIIPFDVIQQKLGQPISVLEYGLSDIRQIQDMTPKTCVDIALNVWDKIISRKLHQVNPMALATYVNRQDPKLHLRVGNVIGKTVVKDIYYALANVEDSALEDTLSVEFLAAHVYPNDLHLADILLQNPYSPIPQEDRKCEHQEYNGFGLLSTIIDDFFSLAHELNCDFITLTAASIEQVGLFKNYGFEVRDSDAGRLAMQFGMGIPMERKL
ncbi:hypothetical protein N5M11_003784 [Vibrio alginolyticus]|nr:hypothetical protein [Vibrio alginolyticus]